MPPNPLLARGHHPSEALFDLLLRRREAGAGPGELRPGPATSRDPAASHQMLAGLIQNPGTRSFSGHLCFVL